MAKYHALKTKEGFTVYYPFDVPLEQAAQDIQVRREAGTLQNEPPPGTPSGPPYEQMGTGGDTGQGADGSLGIGMQPLPPVQAFDETTPQPSVYQEGPNGGPYGILKGDAQPQLTGNSLAAGRIGAGLQGLLMEGGDEVLGAGQAALDTATNTEPGGQIGQGPPPGQKPMPFRSKYDYYRDRARALDARLLNERPVEAYGARIGGALATGISALPALSEAAIARVAPQMAERLATRTLGRTAGGGVTTKAAATLGDKMVDGAVQGAIGGGVSGFNSGQTNDPEAGLLEDAASRVLGAGGGAALGAGIGAVAPPVMATIGGGARWLGNTLAPGFVNPVKAAQNVIAQNVGEDLTVSPSMGSSGPVQGMAGPSGHVVDDLTLADVSPNIRATLGHVARGNSRGAQVAQKFLTARQEGNPVLGEAGGGMWTKMLKHVREGISSANPRELVAVLSKARAKAAKPAYDKAFAFGNPVGADAAELMKNARVRSGLAKGTRIMKDLGELSEDYKPPAIDENTTSIPVQAWHVAKMGLDATHQTLARQGKKLEAAGVDALRKRVLAMLDGATGGKYTLARQEYAGYSALLDAVESGADVFTQPLDEIAEQFANYSDGEKQLYIAGTARALVAKIVGKGIDANSAWVFFKSPDVQMRLATVLPRGQYQAFINRTMAESEKFKSFMELKGSQTDYRQNVGEAVEEAIAGGGNPESIMAAVAGPGAFRSLTGMVWRWVATNGPRGLHQNVKDEIAKMATETDPVKQQRIVDGIYAAANRVLARQARGRLYKGATLGSMQGGVGGLKADSLPDNSKTPPRGFKQANDGAYYGPDPARPGKFLKWTPD